MIKPMLKKGLVQVYTGDGKGKTTAALGQAFRAIGRGLNVCMVQFLKGSDTGELHSVKSVDPLLRIFRFESKPGFFWTLSEGEKLDTKKEVEKEFALARQLVGKQECDMLILDEVLGAIKNKLLSLDEVCDLIKNKPANVELILTGRDAPPEIVELADLVTEMMQVKHYFTKGVAGRKGIEY